MSDSDTALNHPGMADIGRHAAPTPADDGDLEGACPTRTRRLVPVTYPREFSLNAVSDSDTVLNYPGMTHFGVHGAHFPADDGDLEGVCPTRTRRLGVRDIPSRTQFEFRVRLGHGAESPRAWRTSAGRRRHLQLKTATWRERVLLGHEGPIPVT